MIKHVVLVKTDEPETVDRVLSGLPALLGPVPGLVGVEVAKDFTGRCRGYERMFTMDFSDRRALLGWAANPLHEPIRTTLMRVSEMIVFDFEAAER